MKSIPIPNSELCVYEYDLTSIFDFEELRSYCIEHIEKFDNIKHPGHSSIKSSGFFTHSVTNNFNNLISTIEDKTTEVSNMLIGNSGVTASWKVLETWVLVYKKLGYVNDHHHYQFGMSATCYVSAKDTAPIWFHDIEIPVKTGQLLIFPGFLKHKVKPVTPSHTERIVFAANLYPTFDTSILERNASYCKENTSNNFFFDFLNKP